MSVILAAGKGTRMVSELPKVLHPLLGAPLLEYAVDQVDALGADPKVVVVGFRRELVMDAFAGRGLVWAHQEEQLGTGHAADIGVKAGVQALERAAARGDVTDGDVIVLNGDLPLLREETLRGLLAAHRDGGADVTILTCLKDDPSGYGRIVRGDGAAAGRLRGIVEEKDAAPEVKAIHEINVGVYVFKVNVFRECFARTGRDNVQREYYLTDVVVEAVSSGRRVGTHAVAAEWEISQVNSRREMADASRVLRRRLLEGFMDRGVTIDDPETTYVEKGVEIGAETRILPYTYLARGVKIEAGCEVGPFTHLRPGTLLRRGASIGNFVEVKASEIGAGTKARHLSYIGDAVLGADVNVGAGTVFANYDGEKKHQTRVGDGAFLGSGTILVAPVEVGRAARTGAGAVVTRGRNVPDGATVIGVPAKPLGAAGKKEQP